MEMTFDEIIEEKLWAVRYAESFDNELYRLLDEWGDVLALEEFFSRYLNDLSYFKVTSISEAIRDTLEDRDELERVFLDSTTNLEELFKPLDNRVAVPRDIEEMKTKPSKRRHPSWLRIYAIRLTDGKYIITGGAIKLTKEMRDREHTEKELVKIDKVRAFLKDNDIFDDESFIEYLEIK